jgi:hypothetical protein
VTGGRKELILETEVLAEVSEHEGAEVLNVDHRSWESTAVIEYPRRWRWLGKRRVVIVVTPEGRILRHKI